MTESNTLPAATPESDAVFLREAGLGDMKMATGLAIFMKPSLYNHCKAVALRMSEARGVIGEHLMGQPSACMAVLSRAITWNLDPFAVAQSTYAVKGKIGYEGKLVQAILENSGQLEGRITYDFFGNWDGLRGKFKMEGSGDKKVPVATWKDEDEVGLGVKVSAQVRGEAAPRVEEFYLAEMWPRNSTLWVLRPKQQMIYASVRAYANIAMPAILMGIPFDVDAGELGGGTGLRDITPEKPQPSEFIQERTNPALGYWTAKVNFAASLGDVSNLRKAGLEALPPDVHERFNETCDNRARQIGDAPHASQQAGDQVQDQDQDRDPREDVPLVGEKPEGDQVTVAAVDESAVERSVGEERPTETPFQRGARLLAIITVPGDVTELFASVKEELASKKDRDVWKGTCEARFKELGGVGKMKTAP